MSTDYENMTNPEIVAAVANLDDAERGKALDSLSGDQRKAVEEVISSHPANDGARAAVLERLGREKQIHDSQAWTADGISPNSPLVTEATAGKFTEAADPEGAIDKMVSDTAQKAGGDLLAAAGKDTSKTLSSDDAAKAAHEAARPQAAVGDKVKVVDGQDGEITAVDDAGYATAIKLADGTEVNGVKYLYADKAKAQADADWQKAKK